MTAGHRVVVLDNFSTGKRANLARWSNHAGLSVEVCDIAHGIFAPLSRHGAIDRIVHLAAQVSVVHSVQNPLVDMQVNYGGTLHVLEYARAHGIKKVVFASSAAVYGDAAEVPVLETSRCQPVSPYGIDKLASEFALDYYAAVHGIPTTALRFFNVYGPRQDPSSPYSGVISIFIDRARANLPLTVFGTGQQTRDFVYVGDVVRAIAGALQDGNSRAVANVGTGGEIAVQELAQTVVKLCGGGSEIRHAPPRAGEIEKSRARVERLRELFGVSAQTALVDGLRATLEFNGAT